MPNRLVGESSPYLLQHQNNPVDWRPWGPEALGAAKSLDRPIFLSIGYAACHWCHVMEHESFENEAIAEALNRDFICIKVDREERPDLDQIYMHAVQLLTGHGGWPMSVFLTPDLKPFYGGTYWPPKAGRGMPGFDQIVQAVADAWKNRREMVLEQSTELANHLGQLGASADSDEAAISIDLLQRAVAQLERGFDFTHGGFGHKPKFPHPMDLQLLLRAWRRWPSDGLLKMVRLNLDKMARGGIYDHLAGGFARYSVDERWLVPHFEKMLYDNGLLAGAYLDAYLATGDENYSRIAREVCDYVLNYMHDPQGGFHSTEDADSEGEEGKFYVWSIGEIEALLGKEKAERFCYVYDVSPEGNFEGHNIINLSKTIAQCAALRGWPLDELEAELAESRGKLLAARDRRVRPGKDDKVLASWNGLMIESMARIGAVVGERRFLQAAVGAADFVLRSMRREDGRLLHTWRNGQAKLDAYLDDYAYLTNAFVSLYEATFDERWIEEAASLADAMLAHFADPAGGFFFTADDHEELLVRPKDLQDSSTPSGNSMAATALARLGSLLQRGDYLDAARGAAKASLDLLARSATASGQMLIAIDFLVGPTFEVVVAQREAADDFRKQYLPRCVLACSERGKNRSPSLDSLLSGKTTPEGKEAGVYICRDYVCQAPAIGDSEVAQAWQKLAEDHQSRRM